MTIDICDDCRFSSRDDSGYCGKGLSTTSGSCTGYVRGISARPPFTIEPLHHEDILMVMEWFSMQDEVATLRQMAPEVWHAYNAGPS